ncbi:uncharacterized protein BX663DRAFT_428051, partial [Cokeromyces recurvatus]|uniref:uncharacterized protein n=1 Tax=Cokeromyces recurvatus TaxID=90255 RepID=UPI00221F0747
ICGINHTITADLLEDADSICNELLSILKIVYKARLTMENTNKSSKQKSIDVDVDLEEYNTIQYNFFFSVSNKEEDGAAL